MLSEVKQEGLKHGAHSPPNSVQCLNIVMSELLAWV